MSKYKIKYKMIIKHGIYSCITLIILVLVPFSVAEEFYAYLDDNGTQVFTNIPPVNRNLPPDRRSPSEVNEKTSIVLDDISESESISFDSIIDKYARHYELDPSLIHSIIATESGFNPNAVSSKGACGLMQLMPATADRLGVKDSFDPDQNIRAGVRHFRSLMDMFNNNLALSLAAYNAGENLVRRLGRIPQIQETIDYVQSVTRRYIEKQKNARENEQALNISVPAPTFRFIDSSGVLHLTNIPPIR